MRLTIIATILLGLCCGSKANGDEITDVMAQSLATVRRIESYECNTTLTHSSGKVTTVKMACDGIKFFFDSADIVPPQNLAVIPNVEGFDPQKLFRYRIAF